MSEEVYTSVSDDPPPAPGKPEQAPGDVRDGFGRTMSSLRVSVTDRCNFACTYCMPDTEPVELSDREELLSYEELVTLVRVFVDLGVDNVRITGGEPLLRQDLSTFVAQLNALDGLREVTLTTNGFFLADRLPALVDSGLDRVNFSLDTFCPETFETLARRGGFDRVMDGLGVLLRTPRLDPVKLNVVPMRGVNEDEIPDFVDWARNHDQVVRFIEYMPLNRSRWNPDDVLLTPELKQRIERHHDLVPETTEPGRTARTFRLRGEPGRIGFVTSVSDPFCQSCDRVRLTADGCIKNCLFAYDELNLRQSLRNNVPLDDLAERIRSHYRNKWIGGCVKLRRGELEPEKISRSMSRVGG